MNIHDLLELLHLLQELISYEKYINNAYETAKRAIPKGVRDYDKKKLESFNYTLEVHLGDDIKNKFLRAKFLEEKLYKNSKKYFPLMDQGIGKALNQASLIYEGSQRHKNGKK
ncbi:MAG TPA: hypothetical protein VMX17_14575 [Candidatus Glassbacteria bacterium]|nr:hypothetical protein [Candidatus Glassbacteria bacterium]